MPITPSSSLPAVVRLEPVCRYLFRRVILVPTLAGLSLFAALPAFAQTAPQPPAKTDDGSFGPAVTIVKPEYSDVLRDVVQIVIAVEPRRYPAQSVELLVDGKAVSGVLPIQSKFNWKTNLFKDGQHTLTVRVTDTQGFIGQAETRIFIGNTVAKTPDTLAPVLNWLNLKNGQELSGPVTVRLNAKDDFGVKYVFLKLNSAITPDNKGGLASWMTNRPPYEFNLDTSKFEDGDYVFDAYAWDAGNNEENAPRVKVKFRNHGLNSTPYQEPKIPEPKLPIDQTREAEGSAGLNPPTVGANPSKLPKNPGFQAPEFPSQGGTPTLHNNTIIVETPSSHRLPKPLPPAIASFVAPLREGAARNSAPPSERDADLPREDWVSNAEQLSRPELGARTLALVQPPVVSPAAVNPTVPVIVKPTNPAAISTLPTRIVDVTPTVPKETTAAAWTVLSETPVEAPSTPAPTSNMVLGNRTPRSGTYSITSPLALPRVARNEPVAPHSEKASLPAITIALDKYFKSAASVSHSDSGLTRIASVSPEGLSTPPAETFWRPKHTPSNTGANPRALLTTVQTSPKTSVASGRGASLEVETNREIVERTTTPSGSRVAVKPTVAKSFVPSVVKPVVKPVTVQAPVQQKAVAPMPVTHAPKTLESTHQAAPVKIPVKVAARVPVKVPGKTPLSVLPVPAVGASTHTETKTIGNVPSLPTPPRVAMSPDIKNSARPQHSEAAIVVAPLEPLENTSVIATRNETLAAFAARVKMPLEAVAAANALSTNAKVKRGQSLIVPQALTVTYHGQPITGDIVPLLIGSTSVTPFRFMFEQQGGKIIWNENKQQVTAKSDKYEVTITVGSNKALVNQKEELMDMAAFLLSGRTMVPVRFFESALHATVEWDSSTGRIYVASLP